MHYQVRDLVTDFQIVWRVLNSVPDVDIDVAAVQNHIANIFTNFNIRMVACGNLDNQVGSLLSGKFACSGLNELFCFPGSHQNHGKCGADLEVQLQPT